MFIREVEKGSLNFTTAEKFCCLFSPCQRKGASGALKTYALGGELSLDASRTNGSYGPLAPRWAVLRGFIAQSLLAKF
jgi:hypothetical protein